MTPFQQGFIMAREEAASLAANHTPPVVKKRLMAQETWDEIRSEQRGEQIAAEIIARKIPMH